MRLYVANVSKQIHEFMFWAPEQSAKRPISQVIGIGQQAQIYKDASKEELNAIVEQHLPYGLTRADEIDRTKTFMGLAYQFDKPIDVERIMQASEANDDVLVKEAVERRKEAAAALDNSLSEIARESGSKLEALSLEVEEMEQKNSSADTMSETITVQKQGGRGRRAGKR